MFFPPGMTTDMLIIFPHLFRPAKAQAQTKPKTPDNQPLKIKND